MRSDRFTASALYLLASLVCSSLSNAQSLTHTTIASSGSISLGCDVQVTAYQNTWLRKQGTSSWLQFSAGTALLKNYIGPTGSLGFYQSGTYAGNGASNTSGFDAPVSPQSETWEYAYTNGGPVAGTFPLNLAANSVKIIYGGSAASVFRAQLLDIMVNIPASGNGPATVNNPNTTENGKPVGVLQFLLNNLTSNDVTVNFGGTDVTLKPGINQVRYQGGIDSVTGFPTDVPAQFKGNLITGDDGTKFLYAAYSGWGENAGFHQPAPGDYEVSGNADSGSIFVYPSEQGGSNMVQLQPIRPVTLPQQSLAPGQSWQTVVSSTAPAPTVSTSGSNGTATGTNVGTGSGPGASPVAAAGTAGEGGFFNSPSLDDVIGAGNASANEMKGVLTAKQSAIHGRTWKWWSTSEGGVGQDTSWVNTTVTIMGFGTYKLVNLDLDWLAWFRAMLVLMVKVGFVVSVIKLFMK